MLVVVTGIQQMKDGTFRVLGRPTGGGRAVAVHYDARQIQRLCNPAPKPGEEFVIEVENNRWCVVFPQEAA